MSNKSNIRETEEDIQKKRDLLLASYFFKEFFEALPYIAGVLNQKRQFVYANEALLELLGIHDDHHLCGKRLGEVLGCVYADSHPDGCGNSEACRLCGGFLAVEESLKLDQRVTKEARVRTLIDEGTQAFDLEVTATPVRIEGEKFVVLTVTDISSQKRRRNLERIFFHDILNSAGGLKGFLSFLQEIDDPAEKKEMLHEVNELSNTLIDEIQAQKMILAAETGDLALRPTTVGSGEVLENALRRIQHHQAVEGKELSIAPSSESFTITADVSLLLRVLENMIKNALENSASGGTVTLGAAVTERKDFGEFWVHNREYIPKDIQLQIFQRSFSTKDPNRGLGTYSMKLLGENYLDGAVGFSSTEENGTTFFIRLPRAL